MVPTFDNEHAPDLRLQSVGGQYEFEACVGNEEVIIVSAYGLSGLAQFARSEDLTGAFMSACDALRDALSARESMR